MSNDVSIFTGQTGVATGRRESALAQKLVTSSTNNNRRIQANINGTFKKMVNGEQVGSPIRGEFNAIVVGMLTNVSRLYYKEKFDPNKDATLPNCWSNNGDKPEAGALDPQHKNCADCPMNVKGSGDTGGKACRYQRRVSIMLEGDDSGTVYQFNIPAKSLFGKGTGNIHPFESYVKFLVNNNMSPDLVVTNISFDSNAETMELVFSPLREVSDAEYELVLAAQQRPETDMYTKLTAAQTDGVSKAPRLEKPAPVITRSEEPDDELEEPVKKEKKKEEAPKQEEEDPLASIIDEWGSEDA
tara:strand:- start:91 stop:990 length:900 start_codon:yes stop_codon:yes gene_type:complete